MAKFSKVELLRRILGCGWDTANKILKGEREMCDGQKDRLAEYNRDAGDEYKIVIGE